MADNKEYLIQDQDSGSIMISEEVICTIAELLGLLSQLPLEKQREIKTGAEWWLESKQYAEKQQAERCAG